MAPLSHDLAGVVLPHDTYGTHLNSSGITIDKKLEEEANRLTASNTELENQNSNLQNDTPKVPDQFHALLHHTQYTCLEEGYEDMRL